MSNTQELLHINHDDGVFVVHPDTSFELVYSNEEDLMVLFFSGATMGFRITDQEQREKTLDLLMSMVGCLN